MYNMSKREEILSATKQLFWERGYEATSPRDIQDLSGAGQGSFYHHFRSKRELAYQAMSEVAAERISAFEQDLSGPGTIRERIDRFIAQPKEPLKGCRVGRMVWDGAVDDARLRAPLNRYFQHVEDRLTSELQAEVREGRLELLMPAEQIALAIISMLQGGFTVSRATQASRMDEVALTLRKLLDTVMLER